MFPDLPFCRPIVDQVADKHVWPPDLPIFHDLRMIAEETARWLRPQSEDANKSGSSLSMLRSFAGRAYHAFTEDREREIILELLRGESAPENRPFLLNIRVEYNLAIERTQRF